MNFLIRKTLTNFLSLPRYSSLSHCKLHKFRLYSATATSEPIADAKNDVKKAESKKEASDGAKLIEVQDLYLRSLADMENLRNRTKREIEAAHQFAIQKFVKDLVPVADILDMAINSSSIPESSSLDNTNLSSSLIEGMKMTLEELKKTFFKHGVTIIDPMHQKFDPNYHMALVEIENKEIEPGTIVAVEKKGYLLNGRVIRAASVAISK